MAALGVRGLRKRYRGGALALDGVDLQVGEGEVVGLLGPNGAGKSTLVKICCGLVRASAGEATVAGAPAGSSEARAALGYLAELFRFPGWTTADEVLALHQRLARSDGGRVERAELLALVGLADARDRRVEAMSKGMQQRLGIAQALVGRPAVLLLDEPTSALDPVGRRVVRELLVEVRRRGQSVLLNSHLLSEGELVCDHVAIIAGGRVVSAGAPHDLVRPRGDAPRIVADLVASGERVYEVRVLAGRLLAAGAVSATYVVVLFGACVVVTGLLGCWPDRVIGPTLALAGGAVVISSLALLGSVLLSTTANGIAVFMVFGAGMAAGLLGQIGEALGSGTLGTISDIGEWLLPFQALYQDGLSQLTVDIEGPTRILVELGPFGGAEERGAILWPYAAAYVATVTAAAAVAFARRDL